MPDYGAVGGSGEVALQEWELTGESAGYQGEYHGASGEFESETEGEFEFAAEAEGSYESEAETGQLEQELAYELLAVTNEAELDQFIGNLMKSVGNFAKSGVGKAIGGVLKGVAKTALPMVGSALGSFVLPGVGTAIGGQLGSMASKLLEVGEAEMLGEEEAEVRAAQTFVKWGRDAAKLATLAPVNVPPRVTARAAAVTSARRNAPRLLQRPAPPTRGRSRTSQPQYQRDASRSRSYRDRGSRRPVPRRHPPLRWQWDGTTPWIVNRPYVLDDPEPTPADAWTDGTADGGTVGAAQDDGGDAGGFEF